MTAQEAYKILLSHYNGMKALRCFEYKTLFVFLIVPESFDESKSTKGLMDCCSSVNKTTKQVMDFKPFYISYDEYVKGREIYDFR